MTRWGRLCLMVALFVLSFPAHARVDDAIARRAADLVEVLANRGGAEDIFSPSFTAQVAPGQVRSLADRLSLQNGPVNGVEAITRRSTSDAIIDINYARARVRFNLVIEPRAPYRVIGLWHISTSTPGDSTAKLRADFEALPGRSALLITSLSDTSAPPVLAINPDKQMAVASSFKLWLLAEAARQVDGGSLAWNDIVPLGAPSLPSGIMQDWPRGSVVTVETLATFMISISDNTASDTLFEILGRSRVDAMVRRTGHSAPRATLSTIEAFALKMRANQDLRRLWDRLPPAPAAQMLQSNAARLTLSAIDRTQLAGLPQFIDSVEWFASPRDMANTLHWLRINGGDKARDIMAINKHLAPGEADRFAYVGYKGGSEIGVFAANYLLQTRAGAWFAVTGSWNNTADALNEAQFEALMSRAVALVEGR